MDTTRLTLADLEHEAGKRLDPAWRDYFAGGSGRERTLRENEEAWTRWRPRQCVLAGIREVDLETTVLGLPLRTPLVVAPVAYQGKAHPDGEIAMARACASAGAAFCLSTFAHATPAQVTAAAPDALRLWQVYVFRDRGITRELVAQAVDAGFAAVVLTVDLPVLGARDRERRHDWRLPEHELPAMRFARERGLVGDDVEVIDPSVDWAYLEELCSTLPVPVVVKGVLEVEDARRAAEHGASGIVVSNHGGRQLDGVAPTAEVLSVIAEAVSDRLDLLVDSGIRRGVDVAVALALGARAVLVGRAPLWGLAVGGEDGARAVLELLRDELGAALHLMGVAAAAAVPRETVQRCA